MNKRDEANMGKITIESAIRGLLQIADWNYGKYEQTREPDYESDGDFLMRVVALLKEQEPVEPIENAGFYYCGACKYAFTSARQKYCSDCGRAVKWE